MLNEKKKEFVYLSKNTIASSLFPKYAVRPSDNKSNLHKIQFTDFLINFFSPLLLLLLINIITVNNYYTINK